MVSNRARNLRDPDDPVADLVGMDVEHRVVELLVAVAALRTGIRLVAEARLVSPIEDRVGIEDLQPLVTMKSSVTAQTQWVTRVQTD